MKRSNYLLLFAAAVSILLVGSLLFGGLSFLRGAAGLLFVLLLPGLAITAAFFSRHELGFAERLALAIGFSIAASILSGLALHLTPWGLQTGTLVLVLAGITAIAGLVALLRVRSDPSTTVPVSRPNGVQPVQAGLIALAMLVAGLSIMYARQPTQVSGFEGYTSLWIFPVRIEEGYAVQLGISSMEFEPASYRLELHLDGQSIGEFPDITLSPGDSTQVVAHLDPAQAGEGPVEAFLYRLDDPDEPYRQVTWWPGEGLD